jgi:anaerobic magnesium-protoporphyrin IX monomethyl ester cyclase
MSHVLVANPYILALDPHEARLGRPYAPVNPLVVVAGLQAAGHRVEFHDATFEANEAHFAAVLDQARTAGVTHLALVLDDLSVQVKQCPARICDAQRAMAGMGRDRGMTVLVSGPDVSDHPEAYLGHAHSAVVGEPAQVVVAWAGGGEGLPGVHGLQGAGGRTQVVRELAVLPDPAWSAADLGRYADAWRSRHGTWEAVLSTARGCPYRCNWCAKPTWGRTHVARPPERVAAEIATLRDEHGVDRLWVCDDIFGIRPEWLRALRRAVDTPVPFRCQSRVDLLRDADYVADLAALGCDEVWVGAESGSDAVLRAMDKDGTVADARRATALLRDRGVRVGFFLQLGYPGEGLADVQATIDMVRELRPDAIGVSVSYPLPGTVFHAHVKDHLVDTHWTASMENRTLHPAPFSEEFYRAAREVLRSVHASGMARTRARAFLRGPSRRTGRPAVGAVFHTLRLPLARRRMRALGVPNPTAVPLTW